MTTLQKTLVTARSRSLPEQEFMKPAKPQRCQPGSNRPATASHVAEQIQQLQRERDNVTKRLAELQRKRAIEIQRNTAELLNWRGSGALAKRSQYPTDASAKALGVPK